MASLPAANEPIAGRDGRVTPAWHRYLSRVSTASSSGSASWTVVAISDLTAAQSAGMAADTVGAMFSTTGVQTGSVAVRSFVEARASWFMSATASASANGPGFLAWLRVAQAMGVPALLDGGVVTTYAVATNTVSVITLTDHDLVLIGDGAAVSISGTPYTVVQISAPVAVSGLSLAANAAWKDKVITLNDATGVVAGQVLVILTNTTVCATYANYKKCFACLVESVVGNVVTLAEPLAFHFDAAEVTSCYCYTPRALIGERIALWEGDVSSRWDLVGLTGTEVNRLSLYRPYSTAQSLLMLDCVNTTIRQMVAEGSNYQLSIARACAHTIVDGLEAINCIAHPIDPNNWPRDVLVKNFRATNVGNMLQSHPALGVTYMDGVCSDNGAILPRATNFRVERVKHRSNAGALATGGTGSVSYNAAHAYLIGESSNIWIDYDGPNTTLYANECNEVRLQRCTFGTIGVDGTSHIVDHMIAEDVELIYPSLSRRLRRIQTRSPVEILGVVPSEHLLSGAKSVFAATAANPVVLSSTAHGFANGDLVFIDRSPFMSQIDNGVFTVASSAANTFALSGVDGTAYTAFKGTALAIKGLPITGATQANPVVITSTAHGRANGDRVQIQGVGGMTQLNGNAYTVANVTANTFELSGIDGTGYGAYTSGGVALPGVTGWGIRAFETFDLGSKRQHFKALIIDQAAGSVTLPYVMTVRLFPAVAYASVPQRRSGLIRVRAATDQQGEISASVRYTWNATNVYFDASPADDGYAPAAAATLTLAFGNLSRSFDTVSAENYWLQFDITLGGAGTVTLYQVELEHIGAEMEL